jgi:hypothetical protein
LTRQEHDDVCKQLQLLNNCNHTLLPKYMANADFPLPCTALLVMANANADYFALL